MAVRECRHYMLTATLYLPIPSKQKSNCHMLEAPTSSQTYVSPDEEIPCSMTEI